MYCGSHIDADIIDRHLCTYIMSTYVYLSIYYNYYDIHDDSSMMTILFIVQKYYKRIW